MHCTVDRQRSHLHPSDLRLQMHTFHQAAIYSWRLFWYLSQQETKRSGLAQCQCRMKADAEETMHDCAAVWTLMC